MTEPTPRIFGLDVHKKQVHLAELTPDGRLVRSEQFPATPEGLSIFAATLRPQDEIALEATTNTWAIHDTLAPHVAKVAIANPMKVRLIADAHLKTDAVDATVLAQLHRTHFLPEVWVPDERTRRWRSLLSHRQELTKVQTMWKNRVHSILHRNLVSAPPAGDLFGVTGRRWLAGVVLPIEQRVQLDSSLRLLDATRQERDQLDAVLSREAHGEPRLALLLTVPGLDLATGMTLLAAIGDVVRFKDPKHLVGYLGLCPRVYQSGDHTYHGRLTKAGSASARWMAIQAANLLVRTPSPFQHWFRKLKKAKGHNKAIVAIARKLVVLVWHLLTKHEPYRYAQPARTQAKLARIRIRATGERKKGGVPKGSPVHPNTRAATIKRWADFRARKSAGAAALRDPLGRVS
jgi:transposase